MPSVCSASGLAGYRAFDYYDAVSRCVVRTLLVNETAEALDECANDALCARISCILSYNGSGFHGILNYSLLAVTLAGCAWQQREHHQMHVGALNHQVPGESSSISTSRYTACASDDNNANDNTAVSSVVPDRRRKPPTTRAALLCLGFAMAFQIGLCLVLHCSGISIVWCAGMGWMLYGSRQHPTPISGSRSNLQLWLPLALDFAGIMFYAITAEPITTIAHGCAFVMGATLYWIASRISLQMTIGPHY